MDFDIGAGLQSGAETAKGLLSFKYQQKVQDEYAQKASDRALSNEERMVSVKEMSAQRAAEHAEQIRRGGKQSDFSMETDPNNVKKFGEAKAGGLISEVGTKGYPEAIRLKNELGIDPLGRSTIASNAASTEKTLLGNADLKEVARLRHVISAGNSSELTKKNARDKLVLMMGSEAKATEFILGTIENKLGETTPFKLNKGTGAASRINLDEAPAGMRQVGTSGGKPVYEDQKGKRFIGN